MDTTEPKELSISKDSKYIAIKVRGLTPWLWFARVNVSRNMGIFTGVNGWGEQGNLTEISVDENLIEGEISSAVLQYGE